MPRREGEVLRFGTAMMNILKVNVTAACYGKSPPNATVKMLATHYSEGFRQVKGEFKWLYYHEQAVDSKNPSMPDAKKLLLIPTAWSL